MVADRLLAAQRELLVGEVEVALDDLAQVLLDRELVLRGRRARSRRRGSCRPRRSRSGGRASRAGPRSRRGRRAPRQRPRPPARRAPRRPSMIASASSHACTSSTARTMMLWNGLRQSLLQARLPRAASRASGRSSFADERAAGERAGEIGAALAEARVQRVGVLDVLLDEVLVELRRRRCRARCRRRCGRGRSGSAPGSLSATQLGRALTSGKSSVAVQRDGRERDLARTLERLARARAARRVSGRGRSRRRGR